MDLEPLLQRLRAKTGFMLGEERLSEVRIAATRATAEAGVDLPEWLAQVDAGLASLTTVVEELMVGETYFFREAQHLKLLDEVLPSIVGPISLWSAGCASGEEAWSLAMVARNLGLGDRTRVLGTDISARSIEKARIGRYGEWSLRGPDTHRALGWLTSDQQPRPTYTVAASVRQGVTFEQLNLVTDPFPLGQTVIFCRNVFIYLQRPVIAAIVRRFHHALVEGGWLVVSSSDPPIGLPFQPVHTDHGLFYRRMAPVVAPTPRSLWPVSRRSPLAPVPPAAGPAASASSAARRAASRAASRLPIGRSAGTPVGPSSGTPVGPSSLQATGPAAAASDATSAERDLVAAVQALADQGDAASAERAAVDALRRAPMNAELHYLRALLLVELGRSSDAIESLRRASYLDPGFVMPWMTLGMTLRDAGDSAGGKRAFAKAKRLCALVPPDAPIPMAGGATAAVLGQLAAREEARS